jgi:putative phosphoesterase
MILVVGDTHQCSGALKAVIALAREHKPELLIHTGDNYRDYLGLARELNLPSYGVPGNCDHEEVPEELCFSHGGKQFFLVHGHQYNVKVGLTDLARRGKQLGAHCVVFGHTHVPLMEQHESLLLVNPGSIPWPRVGSKPGYAWLSILGESITGSLRPLHSS